MANKLTLAVMLMIVFVVQYCVQYLSIDWLFGLQSGKSLVVIVGNIHIVEAESRELKASTFKTLKFSID